APCVAPQRLQGEETLRAVAGGSHQMMAADRPAAETPAAKRIEDVASSGIVLLSNANQLGIFTQFRELCFHIRHAELTSSVFDREIREADDLHAELVARGSHRIDHFVVRAAELDHVAADGACRTLRNR